VNATKPRPLATPEAVAEYLGTSTNRLAKWRSAGRGPAYIKEGRTIRYAWASVHAWCEARLEGGTR
jgi:hypothetical protein